MAGVMPLFVRRAWKAASAHQLRLVRIQLENNALLGDLVSYLRRCDCTVTIIGDRTLEVTARELPVDPMVRQADLEIASYLRVWSALHEDAGARVRTSEAVADVEL